MAPAALKDHKTALTAAALLFFMLVAVLVRAIPHAALVDGSFTSLVGTDAWYNLRQVEAMVANYPNYAWFDPMTAYPTGKEIAWGPLFPLITATICIIAGAASRPDIVYVAAWVPPLLAAAAVPLVYLIGKTIGDRLTGLIAAGLIPVISASFFARSIFGFVDHHVAETLFSTLFCLAYIAALAYAARHPVSFREQKTILPVALLALGAGFAYLLGLLVMPTMILFALIVAAFTLVQFLLDFFQDQSSDYLVLVNVVTFGVVILGTVAFGFPHPGLDLSRYTVGHVIACVALIAGTLALYGLSAFLKERPKYYFPAALVALAALAVAVLFVALPEVYNLLISSLISFFGEAPVTTTVMEARAWSFEAAWSTFHWGLVLAAGGAATLIWWSREKANPGHVFVLIWTGIILASTAAHLRYEYYLAANIALLAAIFAGAVINVTWKDAVRLLRPGSGDDAPEPVERQEKAKKGKKGARSRDTGKPKVPPKDRPDPLKVGAFAAVVVVTLLFGGICFGTTLDMAKTVKYGGIDSQWMETLEWMSANTPDPGVDYYAIHDGDTFTYPEESYGVMSWWDYGHLITFVSKRIPNNNPFQHGVAGPNGSAVYLTSTSEEKANQILDNIGTRYVITTHEIATGKFHAPATWADQEVRTTPFQPYFLLPASAGSTSYQAVPFYTQQYYLTMIARLHNLDGSMTDPGPEVLYAEYREPGTVNNSLPVVTRMEQMNATAAAAAVEAYNKSAPAGSAATLLNLFHEIRADSILHPVERVPALQHYRLVHETPQNVFVNAGADGPNLKVIKIFEYVPGAHIKGDGIIEVPVTTNTGRAFTYRQESVNGEFVVPYATSGWSGEVKTTGPYRIAGTGQTFDVTEEDIQQGHTIN